MWKYPSDIRVSENCIAESVNGRKDGTQTIFSVSRRGEIAHRTKYFREMGKISDNGGFYMTKITYDHIQGNRSIVTYATNLNYMTLSARIRSDRI